MLIKVKLNEIDNVQRTPLYEACEMNLADTIIYLLPNIAGMLFTLKKRLKGSHNLIMLVFTKIRIK